MERLDDKPASELTRTLAHELLRQVPQLADDLVASIVRESPVYQDGPVPRDELWHSVHNNIDHVLRWLSGDAGADERDNAIRDTGRRRAQQRVPLESLLRAFRLGGTVIWKAMVGEARRRGEDQVESLLDVATTIWMAVDRFSTVVGDAYRAAELEVLRQDDVRSRATIEALLLGHGRDRVVVTEAASQLGLPASAPYAVIVSEIDHRGGSALVAPQALLDANGIRSSWLARTEHEVGLVALDDRPLGTLADVLRPSLRGRVGVSPPVGGLAEVDHALQLALVAMATVGRGEADIVMLDERLPEALMVASPELTERLVNATLGGVLALAPSERVVLIDTVAQWLQANKSAPQAAERLYCHRNTVFNRLRRFAELTGTSFDDPGAEMSVRLALKALDLNPVR
jgi:hypothetical protein